MVVFTCNACGESLKKAHVEKHYTSFCRRCTVLSCIDCGKDFAGEEYLTHTKCISEAEKYYGTDYKPKESENKGEAKQDSWIELVKTTVQKYEAKDDVANVLQSLLKHTNVPRKKKKFENFLLSALRVRSEDLRHRTWCVLAAALEAQQAEQIGEGKKSNGDSPVKDMETNGKAEEAAEEETKPKKQSKRERKEERSQKQTKKQKKDRKKEENSEETILPQNECIKNKAKKKRKAEDAGNESKDEDKKSKKKTKLQKSEKEVNFNSEAIATSSKSSKRRDQVSDAVEKKSKKKKAKALRDASNLTDLKEEKAVGKKEVEISNGTKPTKRKREENDDVEAAPTKKRKSLTKETEACRFCWSDVISRVLTAGGGELAVKKLRKKVLAAYLASGNVKHEESEVKLWAKFEKRLSKHKDIRVLKEKASFVNR